MDFDLLIIGAGSAGYNGAATAASLGLRVALVDGAKELAGLCILRGCMPSKALLAGADRFQKAGHSADFGIKAPELSLDMPTLMARKDRYIGEFAADRRSQIESGRFPFIHGNAAFLDAHTIEITSGSEAGRKIRSHYFLLATGSEITPPTLPGLAEIGCLTSDLILQDTHIPASLIVLGAGAIALEFAHYYNALGSRVTILQRSEHILKGTDFQTADALRASLEKHGITIHTGVTLEAAEAVAEGKKISYTIAGKPEEIAAEDVLHALGRRPKTKALQLEKAGVELDHGKAIRPTQQTSADHIFIAGDVSGPYEVVHIAIAQAEIAVRNVRRLLDGDTHLENIDYRCKLFVLFTHPELAQVGLTEEEAISRKIDFVAAHYPFNDHGKSLVMGEPDGIVKLVARRDTGEILGASVVGAEASSLIHQIVAVMYYRGTAADITKMPHYHPTLAEIWTYPAEEIAGKVKKLD